MEEQINLNHVVESLSKQNQSLSLSIAYGEALIKKKDEKIKELEEELEQLRKEHIAKMNKEAE